MSKLFVGNLSFDVTERSLESFAQDCGVQVSTVNIIRDINTGKSRGFAFVELAENQDLDTAISAMNGKNLENRTLNVGKARERESRPQGQRRGGPRRGRW